MENASKLEFELGGIKSLRVLINKMLMLPIIVGTVLLVAGLPLIIRIQEGMVRFDWAAPFTSAGHYLLGLFTGESFIYTAGKMELNFLNEFFSYFLASFLYTCVAALIGLILGIILGVLLTGPIWDRLKGAFSALGVVPDFILILVLQRLTAYLFLQHGILLWQVATLDWKRPAIALPLFTMSLIPTIYLVRNLSAHTYQIRSADYILMAKANGLSRRHIYLYHILRNVIPFLKADLQKLVGIILGNLFIVEALFNLRGITRMIFSGFGYNLTANALFVIVLLYLAVYFTLKGAVGCFERIFAQE